MSRLATNEEIEEFNNIINKQYEKVSDSIPEFIYGAYMYYIICAYIKAYSKYDDDVKHRINKHKESINNEMVRCLNVFQEAINYVFEKRALINAENKKGSFISEFKDMFTMSDEDYVIYKEIEKHYNKFSQDFRDISFRDYKGLVSSLMVIVLVDVADNDLEQYHYFLTKFYNHIASLLSITEND